MIILNKKGRAKITARKHSGGIMVGASPTRLFAEFINHNGERNNKISPVWIIECKHPDHYVFEESDNGMCLSVSTDYDHTGDIVEVTLIDEERNYVCDSIQMEVFVF